MDVSHTIVMEEFHSRPICNRPFLVPKTRKLSPRLVFLSASSEGPPKTAAELPVGCELYARGRADHYRSTGNAAGRQPSFMPAVLTA